jgi:hypothetical protein
MPGCPTVKSGAANVWSLLHKFPGARRFSTPFSSPAEARSAGAPGFARTRRLSSRNVVPRGTAALKQHCDIGFAFSPAAGLPSHKKGRISHIKSGSRYEDFTGLAARLRVAVSSSCRSRHSALNWKWVEPMERRVMFNGDLPAWVAPGSAVAHRDGNGWVLDSKGWSPDPPDADAHGEFPVHPVASCWLVTSSTTILTGGYVLRKSSKCAARAELRLSGGKGDKYI